MRVLGYKFLADLEVIGRKPGNGEIDFQAFQFLQGGFAVTDLQLNPDVLVQFHELRQYRGRKITRGANHAY